MSKIGNKPINIPNGVIILYSKNLISVTGPKGKLELIVKNVKIMLVKNFVFIKPLNELNKNKNFQGLYRSLINNMVIGVTKKFQKELVLKGVGFRASLNKNIISLSVGFSHVIDVKIPNNIAILILNQNKNIQISGINKESVGLFASQIRSIRPPEPYLGNGIRYINEIILKKQGKSNVK